MIDTNKLDPALGPNCMHQVPIGKCDLCAGLLAGLSASKPAVEKKAEETPDGKLADPTAQPATDDVVPANDDDGP